MFRNLACFALVLALAGCKHSTSNSSGDGSGKAAKYRIAVIPKGTTHEFWKSVHYGAAQAGKEFGAEIIWQGPLTESDKDGQITIVQNFITKKVDGICLAPNDSQALIAPVKQAKEENIPTVIFDSGLDDEETTISYVATDNHHGGEVAAEEMARRLNEKGKVILLRYNPGSESTYQREEGFLAKMKEYPGIEVISSNEYSGTSPESSLDKAQQLLEKFHDQVQGIFSVCEPNAAGTLKALQESDLAGKVVFIGFDPSNRMVQALSDKEMQGIVLQDPVKMGYLAVKTMVEHLEHKSVDKRVATGEAIATPDNMKDEAMQKLLNPAQFED